MSRVRKLKRQLIKEANKRILGEEQLDEGIFDFFTGLGTKIKRLFTGEKMKKVGNADGYGYYVDEDGNKFIGIAQEDWRYEPGYRKSHVAIYDLKDEEQIKQSLSNLKSKNKKYAGVEEDPFSGRSGDGGSSSNKPTYLPPPIKIVNKQTF